MRDAKALSRHVPTLRSVELVRASIEPAVAGAAAHRHATARLAVLYTKHHAFDSFEDKMAAAIGQSGAAFARALQGPAKSVARCSRTQFQRMRAQRPAFTPAVRSFTASARCMWIKHWRGSKETRRDSKLTNSSIREAIHRGPRMDRHIQPRSR